jgi:signal recognition particle subunit SRP9
MQKMQNKQRKEQPTPAVEAAVPIEQSRASPVPGVASSATPSAGGATAAGGVKKKKPKKKKGQ